MKVLLLFTWLFLWCQIGFCQEKTLRIENRTTHKEISIKENRRIQIITKMYEKFAGRFIILDQNSIAIDGVILNLNEIARIKKHPLLATILIKANFFHMGTVLCLASLFVGALYSIGTLPVILIGIIHLSGGIVGGSTVSNISKGYHVKNDWLFRINGHSCTNLSKTDDIPVD